MHIYVGLQAPISIDESIQLLVNVKGTIVVLANLITTSGWESDGVESVKEDATTYGNGG
jgi:hypothetical protein